MFIWYSCPLVFYKNSKINLLNLFWIQWSKFVPKTDFELIKETQNSTDDKIEASKKQIESIAELVKASQESMDNQSSLLNQLDERVKSIDVESLNKKHDDLEASQKSLDKEMTALREGCQLEEKKLEGQVKTVNELKESVDAIKNVQIAELNQQMVTKEALEKFRTEQEDLVKN